MPACPGAAEVIEAFLAKLERIASASATRGPRKARAR